MEDVSNSQKMTLDQNEKTFWNQAKIASLLTLPTREENSSEEMIFLRCFQNNLKKHFKKEEEKEELKKRQLKNEKERKERWAKRDANNSNSSKKSKKE